MRGKHSVWTLAVSTMALASLPLQGHAAAAPPVPDAGVMPGHPIHDPESDRSRQPHFVGRKNGRVVGYSAFSPHTAGQVTYHSGGAVNTGGMPVWSLFWQPSNLSYTFGTTYEDFMGTYTANVAAVNGTTSNAYYALTQYGGPGATGTTDAMTVTTSRQSGDTYTNDCTDPATTYCVTRGQIETELRAQAIYWGVSPVDTHGTHREYIAYLPPHVGTCTGSSSGCAWDWLHSGSYCAYHSSFTGTYSGTSYTWYYMVMPYAASSEANNNGLWCQTGITPNNYADGDSEVNLTSHELWETTNDPLVNAWYDSGGSEIGDKCSYLYGPKIGSTAYGDYNQVINGTDYEMQGNFSDNATDPATGAAGACVTQGITG